MLTRLKVSGFKNLVDVDVRFGPFTCIAGGNGVGKSNLFDAIRFLSVLADKSLIQAAQLVRNEDERRSGDIHGIFHHVGDKYASSMSFEADMIIPSRGVDDLNQPAVATTTVLRYILTLGYREKNQSLGELELLSEELTYLTKDQAIKNLGFSTTTDWRDSVIIGKGRQSPFISTTQDNNDTVIRQHQDGGTSGRPFPHSATRLPRTVLSATNARESPTALLARREMQSWRLLQLEPKAMRQPDDFSAARRIGMDGSHLAATIYALAAQMPEGMLYARMANELSELLDDVKAITVDRDEKRELYTLMVTHHDGTTMPAKALSDGTLRFLALSALGFDPNAGGVLCMEEPENGIHPKRIPAILELLQNIAVDATMAVDADNPLRQVIINTHSPAVVQQVPQESLLFADSVEQKNEALGIFRGVRFSSLSGTWRQKASDAPPSVALGDVLAYLNPVPVHPTDEQDDLTQGESAPRRIIDRPDVQELQMPLPFEVESE